MSHRNLISIAIAAIALGATLQANHHESHGSDWPMWGGSPNRNMVGEAKNLPVAVEPGKRLSDSDDIDIATTENVLWVAKAGSQAYGNVTVAGGRVYVDSNDGRLYVLDLESGEALQEFNAGAPLSTSPAIAAGRLVIGSQDGELFCLGAKP